MSTTISLIDLAKRINTQHAACVAMARDAVVGIIDVGRLLVEAKDQVRHGEWTTWVEANCDFGVRQASSYMRAYQNRDQIGRTLPISVACRGAMEALAAPGRSHQRGQ